MGMYYTSVFRTRSFAREPIRTVLRGSEWIIRQKVGFPRSFEVRFGPRQFRMQLQSAKRKFGSAGIFVLRQYYEPLLEFGSSFICPGDCVIDGGANQGIYSCAFAAGVGPSGQVYAFEPQEYAIKCLRGNLNLNGFRNVVPFEGALSDASGQIFLNLHGGPVEASISNSPAGTDAVRVVAYSVDDLLEANRIRDVQFIKLDVEGAELKALKGARAMLEKNKPGICIEAYDRALYGHISDYLGKMGYKPYVFGRKASLVTFNGFSPSLNVFFLQ
jgi:FkbM family methyltransferase